MSLAWPLSLLAIIPVAAVALWALLRRDRRQIVVSSLSLWQQALRAADRASLRRRRRVSAAWLLLLAGCLAAVLAGARPIAEFSRPSRRVAVCVCPSIEVSTPQAMRRMVDAADALLGRLSEDDQVQLIVPAESGAMGGWHKAAEARELLEGLRPAPIPAEECIRAEGGLRRPLADSTQPTDPGAQHTYRFVPAGTGTAGGPDVTTIEIAPATAPVTLAALAAETADGGKTVQLFAAAVNRGAETLQVMLAARPVWPEEAPVRAGQVVRSGLSQFSPGHRGSLLVSLPPAPAYLAWLETPQGAIDGLGAGGGLVHRQARKRSVAMIGPDLPAVRRFLAIARDWTLVAEASRADVVIANQVVPPSGKASLVIDPPVAPPSWNRGGPVGPVLLADADVSRDDPVMKDVDLSRTAVRRLTPWIGSDVPLQKVLARYKGDAIILRDEPEGPAAGQPRHVYVAWAMDEENTNFPRSKDFVIFLSSVLDWLSAGGQMKEDFGFLTPLAAGVEKGGGWLFMPADDGDPAWRNADDGSSGGLCRKADGPVSAVTAVGLRYGVPPESAIAAANAAPLPQPQSLKQPTELWPVLLLAAMAMWSAGWVSGLR